MTKSELKKYTKDFIKHVKANYDPSKPLVFWIDLFCGAGGTSTGIHLANAKNVFVAACVNHDANAIKSHAENHPFTLHFTEDITDFAVVENLKYLVDELRKAFPGCKLKIWASLECTNFSKAKGGQARDADSRSLAEHMPMYMALNPDIFWFENVREFMAWGPLDDNGKPVSKTTGRDYMKWLDTMKSFGYKSDSRILNAADFGAYQSRERLFIQFPKNGIPFAWPEQTHTKDKKVSDMFPMPKWKPVREVLDLDDEGNSIFTRKKPLSENTEKRILAGLEKFVAKGERGFTKVYNSGNDKNRVKSFEEPLSTLTTQNSHAIVKADHFIQKYYSGRPKGKVIGIDGPAGTITTVGNQAIVKACQLNDSDKSVNITCSCGNSWVTSEKEYLTEPCEKCGGLEGSVTFLNTYYGNGGAHDTESPSPCVTTKDRIAKIDVKFILDYQYNSAAHDINEPSATLLTKDKFAKVDVKFLDQQYGNSKPASIDVPLGTLTGNPKFALVNAEADNKWIMNTSFNNIGSSIDEPSKTLVASRRHPYIVNANSSTSPPKSIDDSSPSITQRTHLLINPSWFGHTMVIDEPSPTIIARQDKAPLYLLAVESGPVAWIVFEDDTETMIKIKEFMVEYGITDIKMRMLKIPELLQIQGFPKDYKLIGTQTEQKKYIGNAVEVNMARALAFADYELEMKMSA